MKKCSDCGKSFPKLFNLALQWFAFTYTWTFDCVLTHNILVETGQLEIYSTGSFFPYWTLQNMNVKLLSLTWKPKPTVYGVLNGEVFLFILNIKV